MTTELDRPSDLNLLNAWATGDTASGTQLFRRHYPGLYRFLRTKVDEGIEDVVQATFLACIEAVDRFRKESSFKTFLFAIARHKVIHHLRSRARAGQPMDLAEISVAAVTNSPSAIAAGREEERILLEALRRIPLDYQIVVELHYWEEMTVAEIGAVLEAPAGTIKSQLHRGRERLRRQIAVIASSLDQALESTIGGLEGWAHSLRAQLAPPADE